MPKQQKHVTLDPSAINFLQILPPESIANIVAHVGPEEYLQLKLTCRAMAAHMPAVIMDVYDDHNPSPIPKHCPRCGSKTCESFEERHWVQRQAKRRSILKILNQVENDMMKAPSRFSPRVLRCTSCNQLKAKNQFIDAQRKQVRSALFGGEVKEEEKGHLADRSCIECGISSRSGRAMQYTMRDSILVDGEKKFACCVCQKMFALSNRAGKAVDLKNLSDGIMKRLFRWWDTGRHSKLHACRSCSEKVVAGRVPDVEALDSLRSTDED